MSRDAATGTAADPRVAAWVLRALGAGALVLIVVWVAWSHSAVGGDRAVAALVVLSVAWLAFLAGSAHAHG